MRVKVVVFAALVALPVRAQTHHHASHAAVENPAAVEAVVGSVRDAIRPYRDRAAAVRDGYRRVGRDFPGMGQHWLKPALLLRRFDRSRPAILTYIEVDGQPVLVGAVFAAAVDSGGTPPDVAGSAGLWHEHNGTIDEESLDAVVASGSAPGARRLAVLHVWSEVANPDGPYATHNWALPFVRLGLDVPGSTHSDAGRALSLLTTPAYYVERFAALGADAGLVEAALDARRAALTRTVSALRTSDSNSAVLLAALGDEWSLFARDVAVMCAQCPRALAGH